MNRFTDLLSQNSLDAIIVIGCSNIKYITGYLADYCYVVITPSQLYYLTDGRFLVEANQQLSKDYQVTKITKASAYKVLKDILIDTPRVGIDTDISHREYLFIADLLESNTIVDITNDILALRAIKSSQEIQNIEKAQRIAELSLEQLKDYFKVGITELEICARLDYLMRINGSGGVSFDTIVAFGENTAIPHAKPSDRKLRQGDIILIDFGATCSGYRSDMTRTFVFGECSPEIRNIYDIVLNANIKAINSIRIGMKCCDLDKIAREYINSCGYGDRFVHSLGHGVGIDIHEEPFVSRNTGLLDVLKDGMLITIEPGIYIEGVGGVRIEDMILVKVDGNVNLTNSNKNLEIINN